MPKLGCALSISAMLMVNSGLPLMKPLVPSKGSTRKKRSAVAGRIAIDSSAITGTPGARRCKPRTIISSAARSATVTGLRSAFLSTANWAPKWDISTRAAASTMLSRPSASDFASLASMRSSRWWRAPAARAGRDRPRGCADQRAGSDEKTIPRPPACDRAGRKGAKHVSQQGLCASGSLGERIGVRFVALGRLICNETRGPAMAHGAEPTDLELAALISSKICHDVIGPVGAIYNGLEILDEDDDAEAKNYAMDVIRNVTEQASARLQFARFAFGAAGSAGAKIDLATAEQISRGLLGKGKHKLTWRAKPGQMAKDKVKLLLNLIASAITALPRGGD